MLQKTYNEKERYESHKQIIIKRLVTCVQIRQGFLNLYKITSHCPEYLNKANSWMEQIEELKKHIKLLDKHVDFYSLTKTMMGIELE